MPHLRDFDAEALKPGMSVTLPAGTHGEPLRIAGICGTRDAPITIRGAGDVVIDVRRRYHAGIELTDCRFVIVRGITVKNGAYAGLVLRHSSFCEVESCRFENCRRSPLVIYGYSIGIPANPANPWELYGQLPIAAGNRLCDLEFDSGLGPDLLAEYACANTFVNCGIGSVHFRRSCGNVVTQEDACDVHESDLAANNSVTREAPVITSNRAGIACEMPGQDRLWRVAQKELAAFTGFEFKHADSRVDRLVCQTLYLLAARVDLSGRCPISPPPVSYEALDWREDPNVAHGFDAIVHGRDSLIGAECLMVYGAIELGERIVRFMTKDGISPVGWGAAEECGAVRETQIDVPCHLVRALHRHWKLTGLTTLFAPLVEPLAEAFRAWEDWFEPAFNLYRVGASEQLAVAAPVLGLFENCFLMDALQKLSELAGLIAAQPVAEWAMRRSGQVLEGIETHLKPNGYLAATTGSDTAAHPIVPEGIGIELVALRAHPARDPEATDRTYRAIMEHTVPWGDCLVPVTRFSDHRGMFLTMGKDMGSLMAHQARTGRLEALRESMRFVLEMTTRPAFVIPDHWEYFRNRDLETVWRGYVQDPLGQYTMGVANCEQAAEWLMFFKNDLLGIRDDTERVVIAPMLSMGHDVTVSNVPTCKGKIGYHLAWGENSLELDTRRELDDRLIEVRVPVPIEAERITVHSEGLVRHTESVAHDVKTVRYNLDSKQQASRVRWRMTACE
jgi:hypothetical protein